MEAFVDGQPFDLKLGSNHLHLDMSPSQSSVPLFLEEYILANELKLSKFFTVKIVFSETVQKKSTYTENSRWFVQVENYSAKEVLEVNTQFGFEEPLVDSDQVPVFKQIVKGVVLGLPVRIEKATHSNLRFHVYAPSKFEPFSEFISNEQEPDQLDASDQMQTHKCLVAFSTSDLDGNVTVLLKKKRITPEDESAQLHTSRFVKVNQAFLWETTFSEDVQVFIEIGNLKINSSIQLDFLCFENTSLSLLTQLLELTQKLQPFTISENILHFDKSDQEFYSKIYEQIRYQSSSSEITEPDELALETNSFLVEDWFLLGLVNWHLSQAADTAPIVSLVLPQFRNLLNLKDDLLTLSIYQLKKVFGSKWNFLYDFESILDYTRQQVPFLSEDTRLIGETPTVHDQMDLHLDYLGAFALELSVDLSHSSIDAHFKLYSPIAKDYSKSQDFSQGFDYFLFAPLPPVLL